VGADDVGVGLEALFSEDSLDQLGAFVGESRRGFVTVLGASP
jgi:hypothetical protein